MKDEVIQRNRKATDMATLFVVITSMIFRSSFLA